MHRKSRKLTLRSVRMLRGRLAASVADDLTGWVLGASSLLSFAVPASLAAFWV